MKIIQMKLQEKVPYDLHVPLLPGSHTVVMYLYMYFVYIESDVQQRCLLFTQVLHRHLHFFFSKFGENVMT